MTNFIFTVNTDTKATTFDKILNDDISVNPVIPALLKQLTFLMDFSEEEWDTEIWQSMQECVMGMLTSTVFDWDWDIKEPTDEEFGIYRNLVNAVISTEEDSMKKMKVLSVILSNWKAWTIEELDLLYTKLND